MRLETCSRQLDPPSRAHLLYGPDRDLDLCNELALSAQTYVLLTCSCAATPSITRGDRRFVCVGFTHPTPAGDSGQARSRTCKTPAFEQHARPLFLWTRPTCASHE